MQTASAHPAVHDLGSPDVIAEPYAAYHALRDASPVRYVRVPAGLAPGIDSPIHSWALLCHADVFAALRDAETFSSNVTSTLRVMPRLTLLHDDPPRHTHLRRLVNKAFSPKRVADLDPWIRSIAASLLDAVGDGTTELMRDYAIPLPMQVIATLLGIPPEEYATFRAWSEATVGYSGIPPEERAKRVQAMAAYLGKAVVSRREAPMGDLISALVEAEPRSTSRSSARATAALRPPSSPRRRGSRPGARRASARCWRGRASPAITACGGLPLRRGAALRPRGGRARSTRWRSHRPREH